MPKSEFILETERLILRPVESSDIPTLVDIWCDPDVTQYMGGPRDRADLIRSFEETARDPLAEQYDLYPLIEKESGMVIGHCGLLDKEIEGKVEIELIYVLARSAWGRAYATEIAAALKEHAFAVLGLSRLVALIEPGNAPSERVALKAGMHLEKEIVRPSGAVRRLYMLENNI